MKKLPLLFTAFTFGIIGAHAQSASPDGLHAEVKGCHIALTWSASIQSTAAGFSVQRSADGTTWQEIGQLQVATSSDSFRLTDEAPLTGRSSYRLRIDEHSGRFSYSNICEASPDCSRASAISFLNDLSAGK